MESNWVDFRAVKETVSMTMVLDRYQVPGLKKSRDQLRGRCPIHQGDGKDTFHVSVSKGAFHCFSCHARGNVLDLVAALEKCSVRDAALKLQEWFTIASSVPEKPLDCRGVELGESRTGKIDTRTVAGAQLATERKGESTEPNKPLTFQLKGVDHSHRYLAERGITKETAEKFGVGFFPGKGSMSGRVVIPIHNERGELVAYAGRAIDGSEPKYKLPAGFQKSAELFNLHRVTGKAVVVVEGFFDCMKVTQHLTPAVVALMGSSLSAQQEKLLARFRRVLLLLDGDDAGRKAAVEIAGRLVHQKYVQIADPGDGRQPDSMSEGELRSVVGK